MNRFARERAEMVELLRERGITDEKILRAMGKIERHLFVPEPFTTRSYEDSALPIANGQTISQPYTVAYMTQALSVKEGDKVLEVGTGSGYQASILAEVGARVYTIERDLELLAGARKIVEQLGYRIASKGGDGTVGWNEFAPFNGIIVTAGAPEIPAPLLKQLAEGGKIVIPVGDMEIQSLVVATRSGEHFDRRVFEGFKFVPLVGKMGWSH
jgi:protein-L-isoaspartate(D-aspartate) O-methyltransferase